MCKNSNKLRIAVVGGGISALSAAYRVLEAYSKELELKVLSKEKYDKTTTYSAGGIWFPLGNFGPEADERLPQIRDWFAETGAYYEKLIETGENGERGVRSFFAVQMIEEGKENFDIKNIYRGIFPLHKQLSRQELEKMYPHLDLSRMTHGNLVQVYGSNPDIYLSWLEKSIERLGGSISYGVTVGSLTNLAADYDVIINACGMGAKEVAGDEKMVSIKGQSMFVEAPWITTALYLNDDIIIPTGDGKVLLGGSFERSNRDPNVDEPMKQSILKNCSDLLPSLQNAAFVRDAIGLRPFRIGGPRVELEELAGGKVAVIHNYGHGAEGYGLHWGTSGDVLKLFSEWKENSEKNQA